MTKYQKAIKVRKICENASKCKSYNGKSGCVYFSKCEASELFIPPCYESIEKVADVITKEKWNVK